MNIYVKSCVNYVHVYQFAYYYFRVMIDQTLVDSLHGLLNCEKGGLDCPFLLVCPKYRDLRIIFFTPYIGQLIVNSNHYYVKTQNCTRKNAKYIYHAHKLRNLTYL